VKNLRLWALAVCLLCTLPVTAGNGVEPAFYVDSREGGSTSTRVRDKLQRYLHEADCPLGVSVGNHAPQTEFALSFSALSRSPGVNGTGGEEGPALIAVASGGGYSQAAVLVRSSTGIDSVDKLGSVHMAFVGARSVTGYLDQQQLLEQSGIALDAEKTVFTDNHVGAVSLLMHKDVFAAGVDAGLAQKWAATNGLRIIALGPEREAGGIYISQSVDAQSRAACTEALTALRRDGQPGKSIMKLFPDWVQGFKPAGQGR